MGKFSNIGGSGLRTQSVEEDEDPMSGLANLSDCMLVLACGLMVALVVAAHVDLSNITEMQMTDNATEITNVDSVTNESISGDGSSYVDMGKVYQDPETGRYYMVEGEGDNSGK